MIKFSDPNSFLQIFAANHTLIFHNVVLIGFIFSYSFSFFLALFGGEGGQFFSTRWSRLIFFSFFSAFFRQLGLRLRLRTNWRPFLFFLFFPRMAFFTLLPFNNPPHHHQQRREEAKKNLWSAKLRMGKTIKGDEWLVASASSCQQQQQRGKNKMKWKETKKNQRILWFEDFFSAHFIQLYFLSFFFTWVTIIFFIVTSNIYRISPILTAIDWVLLNFGGF